MTLWMRDQENIEKGVQQGIQQGVHAIIEMGLECGLSEDDIIEKLQHKLNMSRQTAEEYFQRFAAEVV